MEQGMKIIIFYFGLGDNFINMSHINMSHRNIFTCCLISLDLNKTQATAA